MTAAAVAMLTVLAAAASAATYEVNTLDYVNTTGCTPQQCSLHTAIEAANQNPGPDTIVFAIGSGRQVMQWIAGTPPIPIITDSVMIDGTTQPGFAGTPLIELEGFRISIGANDCSLRSLSIHGPAPAANSVGIGGNNNVIQGNYLGLDALGNLRGGSDGIFVAFGNNNVIGGGDLQDPLTRNLICGHQSSGICLIDSRDTLVHGNYIGTDSAGRDLGNGFGILLLDFCDGSAIRGNVLAHNNPLSLPGLGGVLLFRGISSHHPNRVHISQNTMVDNGSLGIDLNPEGVTPNDPGDLDDYDLGANGLQNFPVVNRVIVTPGTPGTPGQVVIEGTLDSIAAKDYTLEFFANSACDPSGYGEGERYLGSLTVTTGANGIGRFAATFAAAVDPAEVITATATDPDGNTSEFSACVTAAEAPLAAPIPALSTAGVLAAICLFGMLGYFVLRRRADPARVSNHRSKD